jgi:hypothetical protein
LAPLDQLTINWSPYDLRTTIDPVALWREVHYEWLALTSMLLPSAARRFVINKWRT